MNILQLLGFWLYFTFKNVKFTIFHVNWKRIMTANSHIELKQINTFKTISKNED